MLHESTAQEVPLHGADVTSVTPGLRKLQAHRGPEANRKSTEGQIN